MNYQVPAYLTLFILTGMVLVIATLVLGLRRALLNAPWSNTDRAKALWSVSALLIGWFIAAAVSSIAGLYRPSSGPPTIQYGLLTPIFIGVLAFSIFPSLQRIVASVPSTWLVGVQFYRVLGVIFVVLYAGRHLPGIFALPAGLGDSLVGVLAPFVAAGYAHSPKKSARRVRLWNLLGIADLVIAITLGFLTSPSPLQMAAFDRPSGLITMFPLSLIPVFAVPLSILLHFASLQRLRQEQRAGAQTQRTEQIRSSGQANGKEALVTQR
ncbi:MAG TPA: hypothetical protein VFB79_01450 [Candidatus Angelobacter sp.]|nr:hypothetical protein [Candidatus Angelobacter sp.]